VLLPDTSGAPPSGLGQERRLPLTLYGIQLVLNLIWQPIMFSAHRPDIALADSAGVYKGGGGGAGEGWRTSAGKYLLHM
jgi:hypothetical protein